MSITQNSKIRRITDSTLVVGADIAKKVHVARASDVRGVELGKPQTFDTTRHGLERLLTWIQSLMFEHSYDNVVFGVEPTGHYWMNLDQFLRHEGIQVLLVNPLHVKRTKELEDNSPTKNDRKDARVIALLVMEAEGVQQIDIVDGDARTLPFPDGSFDVVVSNFVVHNIKNPSERAKAIYEMWRVLRPDGRLVISDIIRTSEYVRILDMLTDNVETIRLFYTFPFSRVIVAHKA
ncbi:MAG: transposase [Alicyclobacillaceae bacterium]|nr:transposase [Alicyclobacillaceae bacterium]